MLGKVLTSVTAISGGYMSQGSFRSDLHGVACAYRLVRGCEALPRASPTNQQGGLGWYYFVGTHLLQPRKTTAAAPCNNAVLDSIWLATRLPISGMTQSSHSSVSCSRLVDTCQSHWQRGRDALSLLHCMQTLRLAAFRPWLSSSTVPLRDAREQN